MNKMERWPEASDEARVPPAPMWKQIGKGMAKQWDVPMDGTVAKLRKSRKQAHVSFPHTIIPNVRYCDIYSDGMGRIAYHPHQAGIYRLTRHHGSRYHDACIPASLGRMLACHVGTHDIPIIREGDMLVLDLSHLMIAADERGPL